MSTIEEKRVYGDRAGATEAYVASSTGVVRVAISGDAVGEFGLVHRSAARDVAARGERIAVATESDVVTLTAGESGPDATVEETAFGPAAAVGFDGSDLLAAAPDGRVARRRGEEWIDLEPEPGARADGADDVRAIDGGLLATAGGVYRAGDALESAGLANVRDVSGAAVPLAATDDGLYRLGNGWMEQLEGAFDAVAAVPTGTAGELGRAHAVSGLAVYEHVDGEWTALAETSAPVVDIAYGDAVYAVTENGTFLAAAEAGDGWRPQTLGVRGVEALAVGRER